MPSKIFQRKNFLIKPGYQIKITITVVLSFIIYSIILALILFYPLAQEFYASADIHEQAIISTQVLSLHTRLWPAIFVVAILMGIQIILTSHRIFGPIYRFEQTIKGYLTGDFSTRITLRKYDEFKEMEALLNELAGYIEDGRSKTASFHSSAKKRLTEASNKLTSGDEREVIKARAILDALIGEFNSSGEKA
jgi:methyl-accepting chemotaxis protein